MFEQRINIRFQHTNDDKSWEYSLTMSIYSIQIIFELIGEQIKI